MPRVKLKNPQVPTSSGSPPSTQLFLNYTGTPLLQGLCTCCILCLEYSSPDSGMACSLRCIYVLFLPPSVRLGGHRERGWGNSGTVQNGQKILLESEEKALHYSKHLALSQWQCLGILPGTGSPWFSTASPRYCPRGYGSGSHLSGWREWTLLGPLEGV